MQSTRHKLGLPRRYLLFAIMITFKALFRIRASGLSAIEGMKGPLFVLANHHANLDPFFLIAAIGERIRFLASDFIFRKPLLGRLLRYAGMISKKKFHPDPGALRSLKEACARGEIVGIFPEGEASWTGITGQVAPGLGKLVRHLGANIACFRIRGAYFLQGRWQRRKRIGSVEVELSLALSRQTLAAMEPAAIEAAIADAIRVDPWAGPSVEVDGEPRCQGIERALAQCPACGAAFSLESSRGGFSCAACGARARAKPGRLEWAGGANAKKALPASVEACFAAQDAWLAEKGVSALTGLAALGRFEEHSRRFGRIRATRATLRVAPDDRLIVEPRGSGQELSFDVSGLFLVNVQMGETLEFEYGKRLYSFKFGREKGAYPLYRAISIMNGGRG